MSDIMPKTPDGMLVSIVITFTLIWQARSVAYMLGVPIDLTVYAFTVASFLLLFALMTTMSLISSSPTPS